MTFKHTAPFIPHPLLPGGQLQTLAGQLFATPAQPLLPLSEQVSLPDGDRLLLHIDRPAQDDGRKPLILLMHGLGGSSASSYLLRLAVKLTRLGFTVLRFNHRGCGEGAAELARGIYHAGRTEDLQATLRYIEQRWPERSIAVAAFSLSGNLLLRFLGETDTAAHHPRLVKALAVCPPVDLEACSLALAAWRNWHIDRFFTRLLVQTAREKNRLFPDVSPPPLPRRLNLRVFDEIYTAPFAGFPSRDAYYTTSSAKRHLPGIAVPTLLLAADDDPIIPRQSFAGAAFSAKVTVQFEKSGGHMGFLAARPTRFGDKRWMDEYVASWAEAFAV